MALMGFNVIEKLQEASPRVQGDILSLFVNQTIRQQEYLHSNGLRDHILGHIVADHQTFLRLHAKPFCNFPVIVGVRLAESDVLIGGIPNEK